MNIPDEAVEAAVRVYEDAEVCGVIWDRNDSRAEAHRLVLAILNAAVPHLLANLRPGYLTYTIEDLRGDIWEMTDAELREALREASAKGWNNGFKAGHSNSWPHPLPINPYEAKP